VKDFVVTLEQSKVGFSRAKLLIESLGKFLYSFVNSLMYFYTPAFTLL